MSVEQVYPPVTDNQKLNEGYFSAQACETVAIGSCVLLERNVICYAGPIKGAPTAEGRVILLNPVDYNNLKECVEKRKH